MSTPNRFHEALEAGGWRRLDQAAGFDFAKANWRIVYDTSSWLVTFTEGGDQRGFDVHVPGEYEVGWTVNLIEHLCSIEDERRRLVHALKSIVERPEDAARLAHLALTPERGIGRDEK